MHLSLYLCSEMEHLSGWHGNLLRAWMVGELEAGVAIRSLEEISLVNCFWTSPREAPLAALGSLKAVSLALPCKGSAAHDGLAMLKPSQTWNTKVGRGVCLHAIIKVTMPCCFWIGHFNFDSSSSFLPMFPLIPIHLYHCHKIDQTNPSLGLFLDITCEKHSLSNKYTTLLCPTLRSQGPPLSHVRLPHQVHSSPNYRAKESNTQLTD